LHIFSQDLRDFEPAEGGLMRQLVPSLVLTSLLAIAAGGCNSGPDPSADVTRALKEANMPQVTVDWDSDARVAHLKGTVERVADRQRAEELAAAAVGTSGRVLNELTVRNINEETADDYDDRIESDLADRIDEDPALKDLDIDFSVNNGAVTITGEVRSAEEKQRVGDIVRSAAGVKDMANALKIAPVNQ
jgi:osmotically-inducible protein OsmY